MCSRGSFVRFVALEWAWQLGLRCVYISGICLYTPWDLGVHTDMTRSTRMDHRLGYWSWSRMEWNGKEYFIWSETLTLYSRKRFLYIVGNASIWLETLPSYRKRFLLPATYLSTSLVYPWAETLPSACWKRFLLPVDRKRFLLPVTCFSTNSEWRI